MSIQIHIESLAFFVTSLEAHYLENRERLRDAALPKILDDYVKEYVKRQNENLQHELATIYTRIREEMK